MIPGDDPAWAGAALYSQRNLRVYDLTLAINCRALWRCSRRHLVELYNGRVSGRHLDIGVATGWLLDTCRFPVTQPAITLMDLNPDTLAAASARLIRYRPQVHQANVLEPFGLPEGAFDSVAMSMLFHCVPGAMPAKAVAFEHARSVLKPGGMLFGATILNGGVLHTSLSRRAMGAFNRKGHFDNLGDNLDDLAAGLQRVSNDVELRVVGTVALFSARI